MSKTATQERLVHEGLIEDIVKKAETYERIRNERMDLTKQESEAQADLLAAMHKHNQNDYTFEGKRVFIVGGKEKVRVRSIDSADPDKEEWKEEE
jgi:hypothetical protein